MSSIIYEENSKYDIEKPKWHRKIGVSC